MPIRPIDMLSMAPRSQEASNQHVANQNKVNHAQEAVAEQFGRHVKENSEVVVQTVKGEEIEYRYDAKEKGNGCYQGKGKSKQNSKKNDKDKKKPEDTKKSQFDIKI